MKKNQRIALVLRYLLILNALIWVLLAIFTVVQRYKNGSISPFTILLIGMMIGNGLVFGWCSWRLSMRSYQIIYIAWLVLNIILTFTDQFGALDLITLILDTLILSLLLFWMRYGHIQIEES
ncbi:MAG: hypothetical protein GYA18_04405 [Chloroflexi bacterium]|jgi:hypothetical protein|nr:hypothetical protein [Chloroflexota bacterium]